MVGGGIEGRHFHVAFVTGGGVEEMARSLRNSSEKQNRHLFHLPFFFQSVAIFSFFLRLDDFKVPKSLDSLITQL